MHCGRLWASIAISGFGLLACSDSTTTPPVAARVAFESQPSATVASAQPLGNVRVTVLTADGEIAVGTYRQVTISLLASDPSAQLSGTTVVATNTGVANFQDLSIVRAGTDFRLAASAAGLEGATSQPFTVTPAPPSQLRFDPFDHSLMMVGRDLPVVVRLTDAAGNTVPGATNQVTIGYTPLGSFGMPGPQDGLFGPTTVAAVNGVATFSGLTFHKTGSYTLSATASGLAPATSSQLAMQSAAPTNLMFVTQPANGTAGTALPPFSVQLVDEYGNGESIPPGPTYSVTLSMGNNPSGATLGGTLTVQGPGVLRITFSNVTIDRPGTGYTLVATSGGRTVTSAPFNIQ